MIKNPKIEDFQIEDTLEIAHIEWKEIEHILGKRKYKQFCKWMNGQTCIKEGAFVCDVKNFLRKSQNRFFD